jgi:LAGLIDADG DNA endonuclease family/LAGLIDADG endonuclease
MQNYTTIELGPALIPRASSNLVESKENFELERLRSKWGPYLAGLIEADGSFAIYDKDSKAKRYLPKILIVFSLDDIPLANKSLFITKVGKLSVKKNQGCAIWQIQNMEDVIKTINIINGFMRTPKIEALHRAVEWYNNFKGTKIEPLGLDLSPIESNAWLAGFTTSNSSFLMTPYIRRNYNKIILKFELNVNVIIPTTGKGTNLDTSVYFLLFSKISEYFKTSFITKPDRRVDHIKYTFILFAYQPKSKDKVLEYFNQFPLLGIISKDYELWSETLSLNKIHWTPKEISNLKMRKQQNVLSNIALHKNLVSYYPNLELNANQRNFSTLRTNNLNLQKRTNIPTSMCTDLEIWGKNLPSGIGWGKLTRQESKMVAVPPYQYSVIVGLLLSDGWLVIPSSTNISPRLGLTQSLSHLKYVMFVFNALSHYCHRYPVIRERKRGIMTHFSVEFVTRALPCFLDIYSLFYINKVKVIPQNIYELLTPVVLAHMIMGMVDLRVKVFIFVLIPILFRM